MAVVSSAIGCPPASPPATPAIPAPTPPPPVVPASPPTPADPFPLGAGPGRTYETRSRDDSRVELGISSFGRFDGYGKVPEKGRVRVQVVKGTVRGSECSVLEFRADNAIVQELFLTRTADGVWLAKRSWGDEFMKFEAEFESPIEIVKLPLKAGETWRTTAKLPGGNIDSEEWAFTNKGEESITAKAGTYQAYRIKEEHGRMTLWISPGVGIVQLMAVFPTRRGSPNREQIFELAELDGEK